MLIVTALVTLQSVLLVAGAWRNDLAIQHNMGVAQAEVLSAGPRRSTIEFVTPESRHLPARARCAVPVRIGYRHADLRRIQQEGPEPGPGAAPQRRAGDHPGGVHRGGGLAGRGGRCWGVWRWPTSGWTAARHRPNASTCKFRAPYARRKPYRQRALTLWCCARWDRRRIIPPPGQWCQQLSSSDTRASAPNGSRSPRDRTG